MITGQDLVEWVNRRYMELGNEKFMRKAPFASQKQYDWFKNAKWDYNLLTITIPFPNKTYKFRTIVDYDESGVAYGIVYYLPDDINDINVFESPLLSDNVLFHPSFTYKKNMKDVYEEMYFIMCRICEMFDVK